ncbi:MAG: SurA N-terminal domain-containing protein [Candidatus Omnitrophica bacterium]|nr:SurA N-terminal domain-containing protein [Candidatus Omnitrophota bacterium]
MRRNILFKSVYLLALEIFCSGTHLYAAEVVNRIIAVVNDEVITQSELEESMLPFVADYRVRYGEEELGDKIDEARADALNRLIEEKLLLEESKKREVDVTEKEIDERIERVKKKFKDEDEFYQVIRASGMSIAKLREKYKGQIMMRKLVNALINARVQISPTQIAAFYYGNRELFSTPKMVSFKVLLLKPTDERNLVETESLSLQVLDRLRAGESFDALVEQYSQGPNIDKGGDMDYMPEDGIIEEIKEVLSKLEVGETSGLIKTSAGFNIIRLTDRKEAGTKTLEEVTGLVRERLFQREAELTLREFVDELKEDAYIKIN